MPLYNQLLPRCEAQKIALNLDLPDPTISVSDPENLKKTTKKLVSAAMKRIVRHGTITIAAKKGTKSALILTVKDTGAALDPQERDKLEDDTTTVRSRMGYGTTITVKIPA